MELVDRYVHAVGSYLPRAQRADIVDELSEDLHSEFDDRAAKLGRALTVVEEEAILLQRGHPMSVASRYLPQRSLIGPALLPLYFLVLKIVAAVVSGVFLLIVAPIRVFEGASVFGATVASLFDLWIVIWIPVGIVTFIFATLERVQLRDPAYGWDPRRLPQVRSTNAISRSESIVQIALTTLFLLWLLSNAPLPSVGLARGSLNGGGTLWQTLYHAAYLPALLLTLANLGLAVANALRPYWTPLRLASRAAIDLVTAAIAFFVLWTARVQILTDATLEAHGGTGAALAYAWVHLNVALVVAIIGIVSVATSCKYAIRLGRMLSSHVR